MLTEDAAIAMPPLASWFGPRDVIGGLSAPRSRCRATWRWKALITTANGQPALGFYAWDEATDVYLPFALNVLTFRGDKICDVVAFAVRAIDADRARALPPLGRRAADATRASERVRAFRIA